MAGKIINCMLFLVTMLLNCSNGQTPFGMPYLGLQYNPYTSPLFGYGLGPQYATLYGSLASNYLYGGVGAYGGVPSYVGYPGGYGMYGGFGALGYGTHGTVDAYNRYYGYDPLDYRTGSNPDAGSLTQKVTRKVAKETSPELS